VPAVCVCAVAFPAKSQLSETPPKDSQLGASVALGLTSVSAAVASDGAVAAGSPITVSSRAKRVVGSVSVTGGRSVVSMIIRQGRMVAAGSVVELSGSSVARVDGRMVSVSGALGMVGAVEAG
jgi:hypothetical protein